MTQRAISLRLSLDLYDAVKRMAKAKRVSMNKLIEESLIAAAREERSNRVRKAFQMIPKEEQDVEYGFAAQSEVVLGED